MINQTLRTLDRIPYGGRCQILELDTSSESLLRLMEMGLTVGAEVTMERIAPLNSPFSVRLGGCILAVRREDAERITVTPLLLNEAAV